MAGANPTADEFVHSLAALRPADAEGAEPYAGVRMGQIFKLAKEYGRWSGAPRS